MIPKWMHRDVWARILSRRNMVAECWEFDGTLDTGGYGSISVLGVKLKVHRVAWEVCEGPIPNGLYVLHRCDRPCCFNPKHLFLGNQSVNMYDMFTKGRGGNRKGFANGRAKLTEVQVQEILNYLQSGSYTQKQLGKMYGVAQTTISYINGAGWADLKEVRNVTS